jgi:hypothetical protein
MGIAARIRYHRVRAGKSPAEVATQIGLNDAWYHDLEHHDGELASTLTLFQAIELAHALDTQLHSLLGEMTAADERIALTELPQRVRAHLASTGLTVDQFEEQVGWDLRDFLEAPIKVAAESPILFLQALAAPLGVNWLCLVPDEHAV